MEDFLETYGTRLDEAFAGDYFDAGCQERLHADIMKRMTPKERDDQIEGEKTLAESKQCLLEELKAEKRERDKTEYIASWKRYLAEREAYETELSEMMSGFGHVAGEGGRIVASGARKRTFSRERFSDVRYAIVDISRDRQGFRQSTKLTPDDLPYDEALTEMRARSFTFTITYNEGIRDAGGMMMSESRTKVLMLSPDLPEDSSRPVNELENVLGAAWKKGRGAIDAALSSIEGDLKAQRDLAFSLNSGLLEKSVNMRVVENDYDKLPGGQSSAFLQALRYASDELGQDMYVDLGGCGEERRAATNPGGSYDIVVPF